MGKINQGNQKIARGRGNQGDWTPSAFDEENSGELEHYHDHNEAIARRKRERKLAAGARRAVRKKKSGRDKQRRPK